MLQRVPTVSQVRAEIQRRRVDQHADEIRHNCRTLAGFVREAWHVLLPSTMYIHGWHIDAIADHLEAVTRGDILRLRINVPPGCMKSLLVSVFWPAWEWGPRGLPACEYLTTSYSDAWVKRDSRRMRDLVQSTWFRSLWPLELLRAGETSFENAQRGKREGRPFVSLTGGRGDRVIIDDPHSTETVESDAERATALRVFRESVPLRVNDPKRSAIVLIMQRLHENDICGWIDRTGGWTSLILPMEYEADRRCRTPIGFVDPRQSDGDLLFPERFSRDTIERDKRTMGSFAVAGQFQQRPAPREGGMFKRHWFTVERALPADIIATCRGWDLAATEKQQGVEPAFTAGIRLAVSKGGRYYIEHAVRDQVGPAGVERLIKNTATQDGNKVRQSLPQDPGQAGKAQVQAFAKLLAGHDVRFSPETGDKAQRADPVSAQAEAGNVVLIEGAWNEAFLNEVSMFPGGRHKDQVDALSRAFGELLVLQRIAAQNDDIAIVRV